MATSRRRFVQRGLAGAFGIGAFAKHSVSFGLGRSQSIPSQTAGLLSCARLESGEHICARIDLTGRLVSTMHLPERGHGIAVSPNGDTIAVCSRRPGRWISIADTGFFEERNLILARHDRHFYGHAVFSRDGTLLFASENDFNAGRGVIGVYDMSSNGNRVYEFSSGGIGPHEIVLSRDGRHLLIANGGIETHPDYPRMKLNLGEMRSNLTIVDFQQTSKPKRYEIPSEFRSLSIRHLCQSQDGTIWLAAQDQVSSGRQTPLVFRARIGRVALEPISLKTLDTKHHRYVGSIAASSSSHLVGVTAPRDNFALVLDPNSKTELNTFEVEDVCGVASLGSSCWFAAGTGAITKNGIKLKDHAAIHWDNHLVPAPPGPGFE